VVGLGQFDTAVLATESNVLQKYDLLAYSLQSVSFGLRDRLQDCDELRIGVGVPSPLSARLDLLVEAADAGGARASRKELLAALLLTAPESPEQLSEMIRRYRIAKVGEATVQGFDRQRVLSPEATKPGPRSRRRRR
jgi:hypothetical protein